MSIRRTIFCLLWFGLAFIHLYVGFLSAIHIITTAGIIHLIFLVLFIINSINQKNKFNEYMLLAKPYLKKLIKKATEFKKSNNFNLKKSVFTENSEDFSEEYWWINGNYLLSIKSPEWYQETITNDNTYDDFINENKNNTPLFERKIELTSIQYYKTEGNKRYETRIKGGGSSLSGAIIGGAIAGDAGAIIGSRKEFESKEIEHDERKIVLVYQKKAKLQKEKFVYADYFEVFEQLIPEKNYELLLLKTYNKSKRKTRK